MLPCEQLSHVVQGGENPHPANERNGAVMIELPSRNMIVELILDRFRQFEFQACMREFGYSKATSFNRRAENVNLSRFAVPVPAEIV